MSTSLDVEEACDSTTLDVRAMVEKNVATCYVMAGRSLAIPQAESNGLA